MNDSATWFWEDSKGKWHPHPEDAAEKLEAAYYSRIFGNKVRDLGLGSFYVILDGPSGTGKQFASDSSTHSQNVRRGYEGRSIPRVDVDPHERAMARKSQGNNSNYIDFGFDQAPVDPATLEDGGSSHKSSKPSTPSARRKPVHGIWKEAFVGKRSGGMKEKKNIWKNRYLIVTTEAVGIYVNRTKEKEKIALAKIARVESMHDHRCEPGFHHFVIKTYASHEYYFRTATLADTNEWIDVLNDALKWDRDRDSRIADDLAQLTPIGGTTTTTTTTAATAVAPAVTQPVANSSPIGTPIGTPHGTPHTPHSPHMPPGGGSNPLNMQPPYTGSPAPGGGFPPGFNPNPNPNPNVNPNPNPNPFNPNPTGYNPSPTNTGYPPNTGGGGGGYNPPNTGGGYNPPNTGGYNPPNIGGGGYPPNTGGGYNPSPTNTGYPPNTGGGGYNPPNTGGGYNPTNTGYNPPNTGGGGGYPPNTGGGYPPNTGGGYPPNTGGGYNPPNTTYQPPANPSWPPNTGYQPGWNGGGAPNTGFSPYNTPPTGVPGPGAYVPPPSAMPTYTPGYPPMY